MDGWLGTLESWDKALFLRLNALGTPDFDAFWVAITQLETWIPLYLLSIYLFFRYHDPKRAGIMVVQVFALAYAIVAVMHGVKEWTARPRPNNDPSLPDTVRILQEPVDFSFFSGHAATSMGLATLVFCFLQGRYRWAGAVFVWPAFFAYSRIYVGVHYPLDVTVGLLFGFLSGYGSYRLTRRFTRPPGLA